jgi:hypothetical protein
MSESSADTKDEIGWNDCDFCGEPLDKYGTARFAELATSEPMTFVETGFCSWQHLSEWIARGEPTFDRYSESEPPTRRERAGDWLTDTGALLLIVVWSAFGTFGLYTLGRHIF